MEPRPFLFVVGDIHGCYYTLRQLLQQHWDPETEQLIQVGDLINKGNHPALVVQYARQLQQKHQAIFLQGNHEQMAIQHQRGQRHSGWDAHFFAPTIKRYERARRDWADDVAWFSRLPTHWENDRVLVSHAGISKHPEALDPQSKHGLLWHRSEVKNLGKLQVHGHTPCRDGFPQFVPASNAWNVDTGAFMGLALTGLRVNAQTGEAFCFVQTMTDERDIF